MEIEIKNEEGELLTKQKTLEGVIDYLLLVLKENGFDLKIELTGWQKENLNCGMTLEEVKYYGKEYNGNR